MKKRLLMYLMTPFLCTLGALVLFAQGAFAFTIEQTGASNEGDFVLEPAKVEVALDPGTQVTKQLTVQNRTGEKRSFAVEIEDIRGSDDTSTAVILMGDADGPYPLRKYILPEVSSFELEQGEKITLTITIDIPAGTPPGGRFGTVLLSSTPSTDGLSETEKSGAKIITRLGSLFFVRVNGDVVEDGALKDFRIDGGKLLYTTGTPESFEILFENNGNVHLNPYGSITVRNLAGKDVDEIEIKPYYALPDSLRSRTVAWERELMMGRYTAELKLYPGYGEEFTLRKISFWVIPLPIIAGVLAILLLVIFIGRFIGKNFEFRKKAR